MNVVEQLYNVGVDRFPCSINKSPAVPKDVDWHEEAKRHPAELVWPSALVGVPVPPNVLVIDLDSYKGVTREEVETTLGCRLPWDEALVQTTQNGGQHYAFYIDWPAVQGSNLLKVRGFDTRVAGKGYICTGYGYEWQGFGLLRLACPETLPRLPDECRPSLGHVERTASTVSTDYELNDTEVSEALRHIDPSCGRGEWVKVGLALRSAYRDDEVAGLELFRAWSAGDLYGGDMPPNYVAEHIEHQWFSFKPEGDTTIATLFYLAIEGGWKPPARFDTALAFGEGAIDAEAFNGLIDRIISSGGDSKQTQSLLDEINESGCNELQGLLLRNELKAIMRSSKILDKDLSQLIDKATSKTTTMPTAGYGANDTDNAAVFLSTHYAEGTLIRCDSEFYHYDGKAWAPISAELLAHQVAGSMADSRLQKSRISSCLELVKMLVPTHSGVITSGLPDIIVYQNGVLRLKDGALLAHSPDYRTTSIMPYDYDPAAQCEAWLAFLTEVFDGDNERIGLLQEWLGYLMTQSYAHHKIMLLLGPPRSGKGTIGRVLQALVGEVNFFGGSLSAFATESFLAALRFKPVLFIGDAEKKIAPAKVNQVIERIKSISGNDEVSFDRKFLDALSQTLPTRITVAANSVPNLFDDSGALAGRLLVIPFTKSYYGKEDLELADKLLVELPGIAQWALEGLHRLTQNGKFTESTLGRSESDYIRESYSPLTRFIEDKLVVSDNGKCPSTELYNVYRQWSLEEGEDMLRRRPFIGAIKDALRSSCVRYGSFRGGDGDMVRGFTGVALAENVEATAAAFKPQVVK